MRVAVTGASGLIGGALVPHLRAQGHEVVRFVRRTSGSPDEVMWDPMGGTVDMAALGAVDAVVHLAGAPVGPESYRAIVTGAQRWTDTYKAEIRDSRVRGTDTLARALAMPPGALDASVADEWSFTQTLRHLVMATDTWLGKAILEQSQPYHPAGLPNDDDSPAYDASDFFTESPPFTEVLEARADRQAMVRRYIADVTSEDLAAPRRNPHGPDYPETVLSCLRTILEEEWEHHRYAVRDLDTLAQARPTPG